MKPKAQPGYSAKGAIVSAVWTPPHAFEYAFFALMVYTMLGQSIGVEIPGVGGFGFLFLAGFCLVKLKSARRIILYPIAWLCGCAFAFAVVQLVVHQVSLSDSNVRPFIPWISGLIVVRTLCLRRGFQHRFVVVMLGIGTVALRYIDFSDEGRALLDTAVSGNLSHTNGLAEWFGFCAVYLVVFGISSSRIAVRLTSWLLATGCLYVVGLTVSRATLAAVAISVLIALRKFLKRGFLPLLVLLIGAWIVVGLGVFDDASMKYQERGTVESGRLNVWPRIIDRILEAPFVGYGAPEANTYEYVTGVVRAPIIAFYISGFLREFCRSFCLVCSGFRPFGTRRLVDVTNNRIRFVYLS